MRCNRIGSKLGLGGRIRLLMLALPVALLPSLSSAEKLRIADTTGARDVVIEASDVALAEILAGLASKFRFAIEGNVTAPERPTSLQFRGPLEEGLGRVLRGENFVIIRSADINGGVARIRIFGGSGSIGGGGAQAKAPVPHDAPAMPPAVDTGQPTMTVTAAAADVIAPATAAPLPVLIGDATPIIVGGLEAFREHSNHVLMMSGFGSPPPAPAAPSAAASPASAPGAGGVPSGPEIAAVLQLAEAKVRAMAALVQKAPTSPK